MDKLSKEQKDEMATSFAVLALYDGGVSSRSFARRTIYHQFFHFVDAIV